MLRARTHATGLRVKDGSRSLAKISIASFALLDGQRTTRSFSEIELGPVRDLDVLIAYLRQEAGSLDPADRKALAPLFKKLEDGRSVARKAVLEALRSERYLALLASIEAAAAGPPAGRTGSLRTEVKNEFKKLRKAMRAVDEEAASRRYEAAAGSVWA